MGDGAPVVMVHGTPWSSYVWRHVAPALSETHTVYVYDLPGYGQSEQFEGQDVSLGIQNDVLAELIEYWALDTPAVVGHDFGGATVLRAHLLNGVPFARIALLDAVSLRPWGRRSISTSVNTRTRSRGCPSTSIVPPYRRTSAVRSPAT
jgi:pimeloyl-ACP methyl ester carboxylesterase